MALLFLENFDAFYLSIRRSNSLLDVSSCAQFACNITVRINCVNHCCNCAAFRQWVQGYQGSCVSLPGLNCNNYTDDECQDDVVNRQAAQTVGLSTMSWTCPKFRVVQSCNCSGVAASECRPRDRSCGSYGCHTSIAWITIFGPYATYTGYVYYHSPEIRTCPSYDVGWGWIYFEDVCCSLTNALSNLNLSSDVKPVILKSYNDINMPNEELERLNASVRFRSATKHKDSNLEILSIHDLSELTGTIVDYDYLKNQGLSEKEVVEFLSNYEPDETILIPDGASMLKLVKNAEYLQSIEPQEDTKDNLSLSNLASNFKTSMVDWAKSGFKTVDQETLDSRLDICKGCEYWKPDSYLGLGKCTKCGCSGSKLHLATSKCPIGKW